MQRNKKKKFVIKKKEMEEIPSIIRMKEPEGSPDIPRITRGYSYHQRVTGKSFSGNKKHPPMPYGRYFNAIRTIKDD